MKHTTEPLRRWFQGRLREAYSGPREGNRNEHKKRKTPSKLRTVGRALRYEGRHGVMPATLGEMRRRFPNTHYEPGDFPEPDTRDNSLG